MCGRMTLTRSGSEIAAYFAEAMAGLEALDAREVDGHPLRPRFNLAPSQEVLTLVVSFGPDAAPDAARDRGSDRTGSAAFAWKRWGLVPSWAKDPSVGSRLFNARAETVDTKPSFRAAFKRRRCLVAADGFYEWTPRNRDHKPFLFRPRQGAVMGLAGLHERWQGEGGEVVESCTVLTTEASADLEGVHHRMPVILAPERFAAWLDPETEPGVLAGLLGSAPPGRLERTPVSRYVNDPRHDDPRCLEPEPIVEQVPLFALDGGSAGGSAEADRSSRDEEF